MLLGIDLRVRPEGDGYSEAFLLSVITAAPNILGGGNLVYGLTLNSALD